MGFDYYIDVNETRVFLARQLRVRDVAVFDERHIFSNVSDLLSRTTNQRMADHASKVFTDLLLTLADPEAIKDSHTQDAFIQRYPLTIFPIVRIRKRLISMDDLRARNIAQRFDPDIIVEDGPIRAKNPMTMGEFLQGRRQVQLAIRAKSAEEIQSSKQDVNRPMDVYMTPFKTDVELGTKQLATTQDMDVIYKWQVREEDELNIERLRVRKDDTGIEHQGFMVIPPAGTTSSQGSPMITLSHLTASDVLKQAYIIDSLTQLPSIVEVIAKLGRFDEPAALYKSYPYLQHMAVGADVNNLIRPFNRKKLSPRRSQPSNPVIASKVKKQAKRSIWKTIVKDLEAYGHISAKELGFKKLQKQLESNGTCSSSHSPIPQRRSTFYSFEEAVQKCNQYSNGAQAQIVIQERIVPITLRKGLWELEPLEELSPNASCNVATLKADLQAAIDAHARADEIASSIKAFEEAWNARLEAMKRAMPPTGFQGKSDKRASQGVIIGTFDLAESEAQRLRDEGFDRNFINALEVSDDTMIAEGVTIEKTSILLTILVNIQSKLGVELNRAQQEYVLTQTKPQRPHPDPQEAFRTKVMSMFVVIMMLVQAALPNIIIKHRNAPKSLDDDDQVKDFIVRAFEDYRKMDNNFAKWPREHVTLRAKVDTLWKDISAHQNELNNNAQRGKQRVQTLREKVRSLESISSRYPVWQTFLPQRHETKHSAVFRTKHTPVKLPLYSMKQRQFEKSFGFEDQHVQQPTERVQALHTPTFSEYTPLHVRFYITKFQDENQLFRDDIPLQALITNCESRSGWNAFSNAFNDVTRTPTMQTVRKHLISDSELEHVSFYMNFIRADLCQLLSRVANQFSLSSNTEDDSIDKHIAMFASKLQDTSLRQSMLRLAEQAQHGLDHIMYGVNAAMETAKIKPMDAMFLSHYVFAFVINKAFEIITEEMQVFVEDMFARKFNQTFKTHEEVLADFEKDREKKKQKKILAMRALDNETRLYIKQLQGRNILHKDDVVSLDIHDVTSRDNIGRVRTHSVGKGDDDGYAYDLRDADD